jgi:hypothetical protein
MTNNGTKFESVCLVIAGIAVLFLVFSTVQINVFKAKAIELGYAEYNRTNGNWQFIENK